MRETNSLKNATGMKIVQNLYYYPPGNDYWICYSGILIGAAGGGGTGNNTTVYFDFGGFIMSMFFRWSQDTPGITYNCK